MKVDYSHTVDFLISEFPEFRETEIFKLFDEEDLKLAHIVWGAFAIHAVERLKKNGPNDSIVKKLYSFINEQFSNPGSDPKVLELLAVQIFECFAQDKDSLDFSRKNAVGKARHAVEMSLAYTGVDKPDLTIAPEAEKLVQSIKDWNNKQSKRE